MSRQEIGDLVRKIRDGESFERTGQKMRCSPMTSKAMESGQGTGGLVRILRLAEAKGWVWYAVDPSARVHLLTGTAIKPPEPMPEGSAESPGARQQTHAPDATRTSQDPATPEQPRADPDGSRVA